MATYLTLVNGQIVEVDAAGGSAAVPTRVLPGAAFAVAADTQVLFSEEIEVDGELDIDGVLVEVN